MRLIVGMLLGALLLVAGAYYHDSMQTSTTAPQARPMVNWDVVETNWNSVKLRVQEGWADLRARINRA